MNFRVIPSIFLAATFFISSTVFGQITTFYPDIDTLIIASGCTPPEIICSISTDSSSTDSVKILTGFNTTFYSPELGEYDQFFHRAHFLVKDSLDHYNYELWIEPDSLSSLIPFLVKLDTATTFWWEYNYTFNLKLIVKNQNLKIDSLLQFCQIEQGVSVNSFKGMASHPLTPKIHQNYPNPFNSESFIIYEIPYPADITLSIYNISGQLVRTLVNGFHQAGTYSTKWDAGHLNTGIYFIKLAGGGYSCIRKSSIFR